MKHSEKKAVLVVSFGTSHEETRKLTIDAIEDAIRAAFPGYAVYRAWISAMIRKMLEQRDGMRIPGIAEAMAQMADDGITDIIVQPTHVTNGNENEQMKKEVLSRCSCFRSVRFGDPLLTTEEDSRTVMEAVAGEFSGLTEKQALVLMGHGTAHFSNSVYAAMDYTFKDYGYPNIFLGTAEAYPGIDSVLRMVKRYGPEEVILAPFLIVAGGHAKKDMIGDSPDSWYSRFSAEGFRVSAVLKSLGQYPAVRQLFIDHVKQAIRS